MLRKQTEWYIENQEELLKKYNGKIIIIQEMKVIGSYDTVHEAIFKTKETLTPGTFIIQKVSPGNKDYTQHFRTRAIFKSPVQ